MSIFVSIRKYFSNPVIDIFLLYNVAFIGSGKVYLNFVRVYHHAPYLLILCPVRREIAPRKIIPPPPPKKKKILKLKLKMMGCRVPILPQGA